MLTIPVIFLLTCSLLTCSWLSDQPISVAAHVWLGYEPMFLARTEGWLDSKQVHLVETHSATETLQALKNGKVDAVALTLDETLKARAMGVPLSVVMVFNVSAGADMLVADGNIRQLQEIKGKRIGYEASSVGEIMLAEVLRTTGLKKQDVQLLAINVDKQQEAWHKQQVDAMITYEPTATQLLADGAYNLFDSRQMPNMIVDVLAIRNDVLDRSHAKAIRHLIGAHFRALRHLNHNPQDAAYRMAAHLGLDATNVLVAYKGLVLPDAANNYRLLAKINPELLPSVRHLSDIMVKNQLIKQPDNLSSLIRAEYLPTDFVNN